MSANFTGYGYSNLYPMWGNGVTQSEKTTVDPEEAQSYSTADQPIAQAPVDGKTKLNMTYLIVGVILLIVVFGVGKG